MTTSTQTDNDNLLVLSDDNNESDNLLIKDNNENNSSEDIILFDTDISSDIESEDLKKTSDNKEDNFSFGGFGDDDKDLIKNNNKDSDILSSDTDFSIDTKDSNTLVSDLDVSIDSDKKEVDLGTTTEKEIELVGSMSDILDEAINKFSSRLEVINTEKDIENTHISELKEQKSNIEAQITIGEEKVSELNSEEDLITKNTKSLERMKSANNTDSVKAEISTKVHNAKRKAA